jgi:hypothetical protein
MDYEISYVVFGSSIEGELTHLKAICDKKPLKLSQFFLVGSGAVTRPKGGKATPKQADGRVPYPCLPLPSGFTLTTDKTVWYAAEFAWYVNHQNR